MPRELQTAIPLPHSPANACERCRRGKRRCNRALPTCSTCDKFGRHCVYDDIHFESEPSTQLQHIKSPVDGIRIMALEALGNPAEVTRVSNLYFFSTHPKFPILSEADILLGLPSLSCSPTMDFVTLCLCISLVQHEPSANGVAAAHAPLYNLAKICVSSLEAVGNYAVEAVQSKLLIVLYEIGHGIYPAASISMGSCARLVRYLDSQLGRPASRPDARESEKRNARWMAHNLDRFINLYNGDALIATQDAKESDSLPCGEGLSPNKTVHVTIGTSNIFRVSQFSRECQVASLVGRVTRHLYSPISDAAFHAAEASQLERTLQSYIPILIQEEKSYSNYCGAMAMCFCSLFSLYAFPLASSHGSHIDEEYVWSKLEQLSTKMTQLSELFLKAAEDGRETFTQSPYVSYALYPTAAIQLRLWHRTSNALYKERFDVVVEILRLFGKRWSIAGNFVAALQSMDPPILPPHGFQGS